MELSTPLYADKGRALPLGMLRPAFNGLADKPTASRKTIVTENDNPDAAELAACIARVAERQDRAAFAVLFRHFAPRIKAYMMRSGSDDASAEEFAQEAMVMVWRKAASFDPAQASAATWIFTIARNKRIDAFRRTNRPELDPNDPLLQPAAEQMQDERVADDQTAGALERAMRDLPAEQTELLRLAFYEDMAHSEIAAETGLPLGTVKSRLRLAIGKLRGVLGDAEL
jgi:RNA polymerase sigma-70 factor (ECF subfamily)